MGSLCFPPRPPPCLFFGFSGGRVGSKISLNIELEWQKNQKGGGARNTK